MSLFDDTYQTINEPSEGQFKDKGSKFIAYAFPIRNEEEARTYIGQVKTAHAKARHHCWALRLSPDRTVFRVNDDGEPAGTAGRPILNMLLSADVTNIIVIVVRYFGGTLLGVPGLINAYKTATKEALSIAAIVSRSVRDHYLVEFEYIQMNEVMRMVKEEELNISKQDFDSQCRMEMEIRQSKVNAVLSKLDKLAGLKYTYLYTA